jgi:hypothetical protein
MTKEETDALFMLHTCNGCREMEEDRFHDAVNCAIEKEKQCFYKDSELKWYMLLTLTIGLVMIALMVIATLFGIGYYLVPFAIKNPDKIYLGLILIVFMIFIKWIYGKVVADEKAMQK